jgi:RNA polymerase sigma-70 factor (ECF subfamily)
LAFFAQASSFQGIDEGADLVSQSLPNQYLADPDVQLMLRVVADDHAAFEELMKRYQDRLIGFFFHLVRDRTMAEDMAQEVFLRVFRSRYRYTATARFSTWLFRIAHNLASNQKRGLARRKEIPLANSSADGDTVRAEEEMLAEKSALMPTRLIDSREMQEVVREALESLNERQKMAVLLHKFEGMSYQDIGEIMDLNVVGVKSLLSRARGKLREVLERYV